MRLEFPFPRKDEQMSTKASRRRITPAAISCVKTGSMGEEVQRAEPCP